MGVGGGRVELGLWGGGNSTLQVGLGAGWLASTPPVLHFPSPPPPTPPKTANLASVRAWRTLSAVSTAELVVAPSAEELSPLFILVTPTGALARETPPPADILFPLLSHLVQMVRLYRVACQSPFGCLGVTGGLMACEGPPTFPAHGH
ncbi:hypothetical protein INR49_013564 [Caranx melampygus]|nr:hypothetical protein INR49_013564 [Caranx melampygus]